MFLISIYSRWLINEYFFMDRLNGKHGNVLTVKDLIKKKRKGMLDILFQNISQIYSEICSNDNR